ILLLGSRSSLLLCGCERIPGSAPRRFPSRIRHHLRAELVLLPLLLTHYRRVLQPFVIAVHGFHGVLKAEDAGASLARLIGALRGIAFQYIDPAMIEPE